LLTIEFPANLSTETQGAIRKLLPPPLHKPSISEKDDGVEVHFTTDIDPILSHNANKVNMQGGNEAYDDDDDEGGGRGFPGSQQVQCNQQ